MLLNGADVVVVEILVLRLIFTHQIVRDELGGWYSWVYIIENYGTI